MPFFKKIKRAFGFSSAEEDFDDDDNNATPISSLERTPYINPFKTETQITPPTNSRVKVAINDPVKIEPDNNNEDISLPDTILNTMLQIVNSSLPEVIKKSIDVETEKKYLSDSIAPVFKSYVSTLKDDVVQKFTEQWKIERDALVATIKDLEVKYNETESKREEIKNTQLSFERQKRALTDKISDLEKTNLKYESEVEQYSLENKSLLNKLKVLQVKFDKIDNGDVADSQTIINELTEKIKFLESELAEQKKLFVENDSQNVEISSALMEELRKRAVDAKSELEAKESEINLLHEKLQLCNEELESVREELGEANNNLEIINEVQEQLATFDEVKKKKDTKISSLTDSLKQRDIEIVELNNTLASLRKTIEDNIISHATTIRELTKKIEQNETNKKELVSDSFDMTILDEVVIVADDKAPKYNTKKNKKEASIADVELNDENIYHLDKKEKTIISAIDDSTDNNDWLAPTPPTFDEIVIAEKESTPSNTVIEKQESNKPISSSQMSLF